MIAFIVASISGFSPPVNNTTSAGWLRIQMNDNQGLVESSDSDPVRMIIKFKLGVKPERIYQHFKERQVTLVKHLRQIDAWVVELATNGSSYALANSMIIDPDVIWSELDGVVGSSEIDPNDNYYLSKQENLRIIGLPQAWEFTTGEQVTIAIIDSGIDLDHPDLMDKLWINFNETPDNGIDDDFNGYVDDIHGWNFIGGNANPQDDFSHGSHIAGIAASKTNNVIGIAGVSWGARIMPLKSLDNVGAGPASAAAEAIIYAADMGARVVNLSWGNETEFEVITLAIEYAQNKGCLIVAAAGNNTSSVDYPAANPGVLAIASTDMDDIPSSFSNRGEQIDLAAPGEDIFSANKIGSYYTSSGTSMSTAHVSGLAALVWSLQPDWDAILVSEAITSTAKDIWSPGIDDLTGWGRIDAYATIERATHHAYLPFVINPVTISPPAQ